MSTTTNIDTAAAIARSESQNEIVTILVDDTETRARVIDALLAANVGDNEIDSVDCNGTAEVWAFDPAGDDGSMIWRVHVRIESDN